MAKENRTVYDKNKPGGATQQSVSFTSTDEGIFQKFFEKEGLKRTEFVRAAIHSYNNRFEWEKSQREIQDLIENQFSEFVERFGTRAEHERDLLKQNQSKAAALTLLLYRFHTTTLHIRALLDRVNFHPRFVADDNTMKAGRGIFDGDWATLMKALTEAVIKGDHGLVQLCDTVLASHFSLNPSIFDIFEDITPLYNNAVVGVTLQFMEDITKAAHEMERLEQLNRRAP